MGVLALLSCIFERLAPLGACIMYTLERVLGHL